jgi:DNA-binding transcriptional MerR regulator
LTVKQFADLAGVTVRTLHYYDQIGLLEPTSVGENGYRYYEEDALFKLQQILFFRELDFSLSEIADIMSTPDFDIVPALAVHRRALEQRVKRLTHLIRTVDKTIHHLEGAITMTNDELFEGFSEEQQAAYEKEARERWDPETVDQSYKRWNSYSKQKQQQIMQEGRDNTAALAAVMDKGHASPEVQEQVARWHQHLRYFYEPTPEILRGLGQMYGDDPRFAANYTKVHPDLPEFFRQAINVYCDKLEQ